MDRKRRGISQPNQQSSKIAIFRSLMKILASNFITFESSKRVTIDNQTDGAAYRKERLASSVLIVGLSSSGTSDERRERVDWHSLMCRLRYDGVEERWIL